MRNFVVALAALLASPFADAALAADDVQDEIQDEEQPGSEIEVDIGRGQVDIERKSGGAPAAEIGGQGDDDLHPLADPDAPAADDTVDDELPGEGPEDLSGPDDDDPLPE
jgi:hypothetical protein